MRLIRQSLLVLIFGVPMLAFTFVCILVIWPLLSAMDWLHEGLAHVRDNFLEALGPIEEFAHTVRSVA